MYIHINTYHKYHHILKPRHGPAGCVDGADGHPAREAQVKGQHPTQRVFGTLGTICPDVLRCPPEPHGLNRSKRVCLGGSPQAPTVVNWVNKTEFDVERL